MPEEASPEKDMSKELGIPKIEWNQVQKALRAAREGRPMPEIAGGAPGWLIKDAKDLDGLPLALKQKLMGFDRAPDTILSVDRLGDMYMDILNRIDGTTVTDGSVVKFLDAITKKTEAISGAGVRIENPKSPESWVIGILGAINNLEDKATREQKALESFPEYQAIETAIGAVPEKMAGTLDAKVTNDLGREVYLKEKLELVWAARLRLHNRKTEVVSAGGSLKMLSPSSEVPLGKGVRLEFTPIQPTDLYILVRLDDLFKKEAGSANKEICPPVETAMVEWQKEGEAWDKPHPEQPPKKQNGDGEDKKEDEKAISIAKKILNSSQEMTKWRKMIADRVGSRKAEQLAFDLFTISLSFDKWDKKLEGIGPYDPRNLIHFDAQKKKDYWDRLQKAGPETTVGAYFAETSEDVDNDKEIQKERGKLSKQADRAYAEHIIKTREERLKTIRENRRRAVFTYSVQEKPKGQLVGDLWDALRDEEAKKSFSTLLSEGKRNWKDLPYLKLSNTAYSGFFGYALGMASKLEQELTNTTFDPKLLVQPEFWVEKRTLINRLAYFSPSVQEKKEAEQEKKLAEVMRTYVRGAIWTGSHLAQPVSGWSWLEEIWPQRRGYFTYGLVWQIYDAIKTSGVLPAEEIRKLKDEVSSYRFAHPPRRR